MAELRIAFLGDSFVNGAGDPAMLGWVGRVCAAAWARGHDVTAYNLGIRRDTSADIAARWQAETSRRLPPAPNAAFVFSFGCNDSVVEDGTQRVAPAETLRNAEAMLTAARAIAPVLMIGPPPVDDEGVNARALALDASLAALCARLAIPYLPVTAALIATPVWLAEAKAGDGAHPQSGGYAALAALVDAWPAWRAWLP